MLVSSLLLVVCGKKNHTEFPEILFGRWIPTQVPQTILGPLAYETLTYLDSGFSALRHRKTGDVWFTVLYGQVFHTSNNLMQYCFGELGELMEQSPFEVHSVNETAITYCWHSTMRRMPTHADGCSGCDCAKILLTSTSKNTMEFTFWQSPPVTHVHLVLKRSGAEPEFDIAILQTMINPYKKCDFRDKWGPNLPEGESTEVAKPKLRGCARGLLEKVKTHKEVSAIYEEYMDGLEAPKPQGEKKCHQLNGWNFKVRNLRPEHAYYIPDIKMQFIEPKLPCDPCDVSYSVSAAIEEDQYISIGFKGQSWEGKFPHPPEHPMRPCYFGMCVDDYDNFTSDRLAVGYASDGMSGSCFREMISESIVGTPKDVRFPLMRGTSVERHDKRTIIRFTISQNWPNKRAFDGWFRTMWAIGNVYGTGGDPCDGLLGFHGVNRAVTPINWLGVLGSLPCDFDSYEYTGSFE